MEKRLKEIVIYILENSSALDPEQRAELEDLQKRLGMSGSSLTEIERSIRRVLSAGADPQAMNALGDFFEAEIQELELTPEANDYLRRLRESGLVTEDQENEILARAARVYQETVDLDEIQFLAASLIFDENLGAIVGGEGGGETDELRRQH